MAGAEKHSAYSAAPAESARGLDFVEEARVRECSAQSNVPMTRVLFLNRSFWPDREATGQFLTELCDDLSQDHEVTIVAGPSLRQRQRRGRLPFVVARIARQSFDCSHLGHQIFKVESRRPISQSGYLLPIGGNSGIPAAATGCDSRRDRSSAARRAGGGAETALGMPADLQRARSLSRYRGSHRRRAQSVPARVAAPRQRLRLRTRRSDRDARP